MDYRIEFSDKEKDPIKIREQRYDTSTSLTLIGKNCTEYGEYVNSNFYHLLENFCDDLKPSNPISGQTWFNSLKNKMYVYDGNFWIELGKTKTPKVPANALSQSVLEVSLKHYLTKDGGQMDGDLYLKETEIGDSEYAAVTKKYVDSKILPPPSDYIPLSGNSTIAGPITLPNIAIDKSNQVIPKMYADDNVPHIDISKNLEMKTDDGTILARCSSSIIRPGNLLFISGYVNFRQNSMVTLNLSNWSKVGYASVHVTQTGNAFFTKDIEPTQDTTPSEPESEVVIKFSAKFYTDKDTSYIKFIRHGNQINNENTQIYFTMMGYLV